MIEYVLVLAVVLSALLSVFPRDLLKAVLIGVGVEGLALAALYQILLAPDVAMTQAIVSSTILTVLLVVAVHKTERWEK
jgi:energy-converting hydrogenase B subunit D